MKMLLQFSRVFKPRLRGLSRLAATVLTLGSTVLLFNGTARSQTIYFLDKFSGPSLNPLWQTNLPSPAYLGSFCPSVQLANYVGAPMFTNFTSLGSNSVLAMTNLMGPLQRVGWSLNTNFSATDFRYEVRFNSLTQSSSTSIDAWLEIWVLSTSNPTNYDITSPYGGCFGGCPYFFTGSSIDSFYSTLNYAYEDNTWYRVVLEGAPGQTIRESICDDTGTELAGVNLQHGADAFSSGFTIALSQAIGCSGVPYPDQVAVNYALLTSSGPAPIIIFQPTSTQFVLVGTNAFFSVAASGEGPLSYQWYFENHALPGQNASSLLLSDVQLTNAGNYTVVIANSSGSVTSAPAALMVGSPPVILTQPKDQVGYWGYSATFSVMVADAPPIFYQWYFDGSAIPSATNATLVLTNLEFNNAGPYWVTVSNMYGGTVSTEATLLVNPAGISLGVYPGLTITGAIGKSFVIQYSVNLRQSNWTTITNVTLSQPTMIWFDSTDNISDGTQPRRYYRVMAIP